MELTNVFREAELIRPPSLKHGETLRSRHQSSHHIAQSGSGNSQSLLPASMAESAETDGHVVAAHRRLRDLGDVHFPRVARSSELSSDGPLAATEVDLRVS